MSLTFDTLGREHPRHSGPELLAMFEILPDSDRAACWRRLAIRAADRHYSRGDLPLVKLRRRPKPVRKHRPARSAQTAARDADWQRGTDALAAIEAETYLTLLAPESEPARGRCHCPHPAHDDNNPSASYRDNLWNCFSCGAGGDVFTLGSALSGLSTRGRDFNELRQWLADRLLGAGL